MNIDDIKAKIRALLAKAATTEHEGEADVFIAKASELMEKYQIELYELGTDDPIGLTKGVNAQNGPMAYKSDVQCALAAYYGARAVINNTTHNRWTVDIIGPESSRLTTELMTAFVWQQVNKVAKTLAAQIGDSQGGAVRKVAKALCVRIRREVAARKAKPPGPGGAFSLVTVDAVQAYIDKLYGANGLTTGKSRPVRYSIMAMEAAKGISLNVQATGRNQLRLQ